MIKSSKEPDFTTKQEGTTSDGMISNPSSTSTSAWSRPKNPRIVRVSRAFGGKDRHSKVSTVKGLRDRRIRLSVPIAIQLYDLQDRLGLNQPSKVIDWLLNEAKHEIDELPPLQIPLGTLLSSHDQGLKINNSINWHNWNLDGTFRDTKSKEISRETSNDKESWTKRNEEGQQFFSSLPNNAMAQNSFLRFDPSNLSLSHLGSSHGLTPQTEDLQNFNIVPLPSTLSMPSGSQFVICPHGMVPSFFPSNVLLMSEHPTQN